MKIKTFLFLFCIYFLPIFPQPELSGEVERSETKRDYRNHINIPEYDPSLMPLKTIRTGTGVWTELNPKVPRVDYIGVDFINPDTGWTVGLWGAVIKTTNAGQSWKTIPTPTGEILIKVHSYNGQMVMIVGHNGTILRSSDGGESFTLLTGITTQELWGVRMLNDTLGWICGRNQTLLKTTDAGLTWQPVVTGFNYHYWQFDFLTEDYFMISCSQGKVLKTTNGGQSFTQYQAGSTQDLYTIDIIDSLHIAAAGNYGKNVYSNDGGVTWTENQYTALSINWIQYINRDTGYITIESAQLQKTTNRGQSWFNPGFNATGEWQFELLTENLPARQAGLGYGVGAGLTVTKTEDGYNTGYNLFLNKNWSDVFFINEMKGFFASAALGEKLYKTEDGGITYVIIENSPEWNYDILFMDSLKGFLGSNTIYKTTDGGANWYTTNGAGQATKIFFISPLIGWAIGGSSIYKTTDAGENWFVQFTHVSSGFTSIYFIDSLNGWVSGGRPQKTTNGGISWVEQTNTNIWNSQDVYFSNQDTGWFIKSPTFYKTTNGGLSWNVVPEIVGPPYSFHFFPAPLHWLINGSRRYITEDGGNTFIDITNDVPTGFGSFAAVTDKLGYAVGSFGLTLRYDDTSYVPVELISFEGRIAKNKTILNWLTASELNNRGFYVEKSFDIVNWFNLSFVEGNGTTTEVNYYSFTDDEIPLEIQYYRLKQIDYDGSFEYSKTIEINPNIEIPAFQLYQNYPNPFNSSTIITFQIPTKSFVNLSLYDIKGEKIIELLNEEKEKGFYKTSLENISLPSGIYFVRMITSTGFSAVIKITLIN